MNHDEVLEVLTGKKVELDDATRQAVDDHLGSCADCRATAEGISAYREAGKQAEAETARILAMARTEKEAMARQPPLGGLTCAEAGALRSGKTPLDEATRLRLAAHDAGCPTCSRLDETEAARTEREVVRLPIRSSMGSRVLLAASLIAALGVGLIVGRATAPETPAGLQHELDGDDLPAARFLVKCGFIDQARTIARHALEKKDLPPRIRKDLEELAK